MEAGADVEADVDASIQGDADLANTEVDVDTTLSNIEADINAAKNADVEICM
jgi:hypothetical protein